MRYQNILSTFATNKSNILIFHQMKKVINILCVAIISVILASLSSLFYVVKQQSVVIIERFGKFTTIANSGFHFKLPGIFGHLLRKKYRKQFTCYADYLPRL